MVVPATAFIGCGGRSTVDAGPQGTAQFADGTGGAAGRPCDGASCGGNQPKSDSTTTGPALCVGNCPVEEPATRCGDGVLDEGETCDDGNTLDGDGCSRECVLQGAWCEAEACLEGRMCGDGVAAGREQCDDGNALDGDGCAADCTLEPGDDGCGESDPPPACAHVCGNGVVEPTEQCDQGDNVGGYGRCEPDCRLGPHCGDGIVQNEYEECERGGGTPPGCGSDCRWHLAPM
jgi:cysteine-rich repeat protein